MASRRTFLGSVGMVVGPLAGANGAARVQANEGTDKELSEEEIIGTFVTFYQKIPDESRERFAGVWELSSGIIDAADAVLAEIPSVDEIADLEDFAEPITGLLRNITENVASVYDIHIDTKYLDKAVRMTGYLPLLAQIWNVLQASMDVLDISDTKQRFVREVRRTDAGKTAVKQFYIAMLLLFTELAFLWSGIGYRTAFGTTRRAANVGLVHLRGKVGLRAYSVLLSIVHWLVRGSIETTASYIIERTGEVAQDLSNSSIEFTRLSEEDISKALPQESSSSLPDHDFGGYGPFGDRVESTANSVIDSSTKTILLENYEDSGIIETTSNEADGDDWGFW